MAGTVLYYLTLIAVLLVSASVIVILYYLNRHFHRENIFCKNDSLCPSYQRCDQEKGYCVSLPGERCTSDNFCSKMAPICNPSGKYCTNFASNDRGTAGNPPRDKVSITSPPCDNGLILNTGANLCQYISTGAKCTIDAECNKGLCSTSTKTCEYSTDFCTGDNTLNPEECAQGYTCDSSALVCTVPGTTPGGDGSPCKSNLECTHGCTCVFPPYGAGYSGVCKSGEASWLTLLSPGASCISPLVGGDTSWCRYDIESFMLCKTSVDCQYPYSQCIGGVCTNNEDPIVPSRFPYDPVGVNISGAFYIPLYPNTPPDADNTTGGKLLTQYYGFLPNGGQFASLKEFNNSQLVTFTSMTSFSITVLNFNTGKSFHTAIYDNPNPVIAMVSIIPDSNDNTMSSLWISFFEPQQQRMYNLVGNSFKSLGSRLWNPSAVSSYTNSGFPQVNFIANPIVTPWDIWFPDGDKPLAWTTHTLFLREGEYCIGVLHSVFGGPYSYQGSVVIRLKDYYDFDPTNFIITSWDALSIADENNMVSVSLLLYGFNKIDSHYQLNTVQAALQVSGSNGLNINSVLIGQQNLGDEILKSSSHFRLSRVVGKAEPLLLVTAFYIVTEGLEYVTYAVKSTGGINISQGSSCSGSLTLPGVADLKYVTPITSCYNLGAFTVWCSTSQARSAFIVLQINASCIQNQFINAPIFSAVYWRRLNSDPTPDDYYIYPIGGSGLPMFLTTDKELTFDQTPVLTPR